MKNPLIAIILVSFYLLIYFLIGSIRPGVFVIVALGSFTPVLIIWMTYIILKYGTYSGNGLKKNENWGYEDYRK